MIDDHAHAYARTYVHVHAHVTIANVQQLHLSTRVTLAGPGSREGLRGVCVRGMYVHA